MLNQYIQEADHESAWLSSLHHPYSIFRSDNFWKLNESEIAQLEQDIILEFGPGYIFDLATEVERAEASRRFEFLEYHKWTLKGEWYYNIVGKLVLATNIKFGFLGNYSGDIGISPFERFELGGDGLSNQNVGIVGRDIISMRGYEVREFDVNSTGGGAVYNKLTMELRYPLSLNPNSSIYVHGFVQGGNAWSSFKEFNPYDMRRSAGFGLRVFLPMFGCLDLIMVLVSTKILTVLILMATDSSTSFLDFEPE